MKEQLEAAIKNYQCSGCVSGPYPNCFKLNAVGVGCKKHWAGTTIVPHVGKIFLGLPKGFCRIGYQKDMIVYIFEMQEQQQKQWKYDYLNVPIWKYKNKKRHILIRGYQPRLNLGFIHVILKGDYDSIDAHEIDITDID